MTDLKQRIEEILSRSFDSYEGMREQASSEILKLIEENYIPKESMKDTPITKFLKNEKEELF